MDIYIPFMEKNPNLLWIYIVFPFPSAKKVEKSTPCAWEAGLCSSVNRTLTVDHFVLILRAFSGGIHENIQLCTINIHVVIGRGGMICLKNGLFEILLPDLLLTGHQDQNKNKWLKQLALLVTYCTNTHCSATQTAIRLSNEELVLVRGERILHDIGFFHQPAKE